MKVFIPFFICAALLVAFVSNMATVENRKAELTHQQNVQDTDSEPVDVSGDELPTEQIFQATMVVRGTEQIRYAKLKDRIYFSTDAYFVINFNNFNISDDGGFGSIAWSSNDGSRLAVHTQDGIIEYVDMEDEEGLPIKRYYASKP